MNEEDAGRPVRLELGFSSNGSQLPDMLLALAAESGETLDVIVQAALLRAAHQDRIDAPTHRS